MMVFEGDIVAYKSEHPEVLILVVVDDGLWDTGIAVCRRRRSEGLNPCCCGWWSLRSAVCRWGGGQIVLILVVVDDGLWDLSKVRWGNYGFHSLNPCCCGWWSLRTKSAMWWPLDYYVPKNEENVVFWWEKCTSLAPDFSKKLLSMQSYQ